MKEYFVDCDCPTCQEMIDLGHYCSPLDERSNRAELASAAFYLPVCGLGLYILYMGTEVTVRPLLTVAYVAGIFIFYLFAAYFACTRCPYQHEDKRCASFFWSSKVSRRLFGKRQGKLPYWFHYTFWGFGMAAFLALPLIVALLRANHGHAVSLIAVVFLWAIAHSLIACRYCKDRHYCLKGRLTVRFTRTGGDA